mmetsp:Transcript_75/g.256  ORF Transcript_75/g.256 Transcript_75/m.256 type:complete len:737 (+) Transcript_75:147-2357(+)|eukprot:CAMPEP_0171546688 /NCGR_PEP_ID=MMETSP0960-20121227/4770_1 /TAXON_ID=87120 /ORGANISM="Aurantiochytrium limacinum, Strain ATCCMYA-1381" /LENGTH=736 /DNA_ID=CAMNT_0012094785 /DNA_START=65 /DNA_END=2275 /DNA_ORIENTATION=+
MSSSEGVAWARLRHTLVNESWEVVHDEGDETLTRDEFWIGRDPSQCQLVLREIIVSGRHCAIVRIRADDHGGERYELLDTSTNGTSVNRSRVGKGKRCPLRKGDTIVLSMHAKNETAKVLHQFEFLPLSDEERRIAQHHATKHNNAKLGLGTNSSRSSNESSTPKVPNATAKEKESEGSATPINANDLDAHAKYIEQMRELRKEFEASEAALRAEYDKELEDVRMELQAEQKRIQIATESEEALQKRIEVLRGEVSEAQESLAKANSDKEMMALELRSEMQKKTSELEAQVAREANRANKLVEDNERQEKELTRLREDKGSLELSLKSVRQQLEMEKKRVRQAADGKLKARLQESTAHSELLEKKLKRAVRTAKDVQAAHPQQMQTFMDRMSALMAEMKESQDQNFKAITETLGGPVTNPGRQSLARAEMQATQFLPDDPEDEEVSSDEEMKNQTNWRTKQDREQKARELDEERERSEDDEEINEYDAMPMSTYVPATQGEGEAPEENEECVTGERLGNLINHQPSHVSSPKDEDDDRDQTNDDDQNACAEPQTLEAGGLDTNLATLNPMDVSMNETRNNEDDCISVVHNDNEEEKGSGENAASRRLGEPQVTKSLDGVNKGVETGKGSNAASSNDQDQEILMDSSPHDATLDGDLDDDIRSHKQKGSANLEENSADVSNKKPLISLRTPKRKKNMFVTQSEGDRADNSEDLDVDEDDPFQDTSDHHNKKSRIADD